MDQSAVQLREQLDLLSELILRLGGMAEDAIGKSVRALVDRDSDVGREVIEGDKEVDALELEIDGLCMSILARHQPMAGDLRFVATAMKITPDIERIADHSVNISERALELNDEPPLDALIDLPMMAARVQQMVRGALDAFVRRDAKVALDVIRMDAEVNRRMEQVFRVLLSYMLSDPTTISRALRTTFVAKYFERIGDQATNICEQIVYMTDARVIKHQAFPND
ncbi:MAG TPA: phosphate signaling complex protein PhoU [Candidatus Polarisedimenticolaceae bacterium]|nr:phosphate signaling complex protein PhoU [Candidatus Polarisedimenticolaceae bacterium]